MAPMGKIRQCFKLSTPAKVVIFGSRVWFSGSTNLTVSLKFSPANPRCHGNEFWDKIGYNSAPVKDN